MSEPIEENTTVRGVIGGQLVIARHRVWANGARLGSDFVCDPANRLWLADQLEAVASEAVAEISRDAPPDHLVVFGRGGDHGEPINVNVENDREGARAYTLSGMSPEVARKLAQDLRNITSN